MTFEKIFLKYTMDFNSFCKLMPYVVTGAAIGSLCRFCYEEIKRIRVRNELLRLLRESHEALEKYKKITEAKEALEKVKETIEDLQNNELKE